METKKNKDGLNNPEQKNTVEGITLYLNSNYNTETQDKNHRSIKYKISL